MKKHYLIPTAVTVLALATMSCGIQFVGSNPTPVPQQPIPQNFNPQLQGPDNVNSGPQGPGPNPGDPVNPGPQGPGPDPLNQGPNPNGGAPGGNPGEGQILSFTADRTTLNQGQCATLQWQIQGGFEAKLNGQPVERSGQQQVCPPQTTVYRLGLDIGNQMVTREVTITVNSGGQNPNPVVITPTKPKKNSKGNQGNVTATPPIKILSVVTIDLQATDLYVDGGKYLHVGVKNNSTQSGNISFGVTCTGSFSVTKGGTSSTISYSNSSVTAAFNPNQERWTNSQIKLDKGVGFYNLTCTVSTLLDTNASNNSVTKTVTITP
jgi:hypothetical protein